MSWISGFWLGTVCREGNMSVLGCDFEALFSFFKNKSNSEINCFAIFNFDADSGILIIILVAMLSSTLPPM